MNTVQTKFVLCALGASLALVACGKNRSRARGTSGPVSLYSGQLPPGYEGDPSYQPYAPTFDNDADFDPATELEGQGRWETLGGQRYFVPQTPAVAGQPGWTPVRDGRWTTGANGQQTWVSNEPFGRVTDHRGLWRHHGRLGWVWRGFPDNHFEPNVVSFCENENQLGWLPYRREYADLYRGTEQFGFDDGFWNGAGEGLGPDPAVDGNVVGLTTVPRERFGSPNVFQDLFARRALTPHPRTRARVRSNFTRRPPAAPQTKRSKPTVTKLVPSALVTPPPEPKRSDPKQTPIPTQAPEQVATPREDRPPAPKPPVAKPRSTWQDPVRPAPTPTPPTPTPAPAPTPEAAPEPRASEPAAPADEAITIYNQGL